MYFVLDIWFHFSLRKFLEAGKHVCVEYPMAMSYAAVADLFDQAQQKGEMTSKYSCNMFRSNLQHVQSLHVTSSGLVLHEEHIELLTPDFKQLKKDIAGKQLEEGKLYFTGTIMYTPQTITASVTVT